MTQTCLHNNLHNLVVDLGGGWSVDVVAVHDSKDRLVIRSATFRPTTDEIPSGGLSSTVCRRFSTGQAVSEFYRNHVAVDLPWLALGIRER